MRGARTTLGVVVACLALHGCGTTALEPRGASATPKKPTAEQRDSAVERNLEARAAAAKAGDRAGVTRAEKELDRLAEGNGDRTPPAGSAQAQDPFFRMIQRFEFKQAPLYVQQIISSADHRMFARVNEDAFCLLTAQARKDAVTAVYAPADRELRDNGVDDFRFVLVPLGGDTATERGALAVGEGGRVRLTGAGQGC